MKIEDLPEMTINDGRVEFKRIPTVIVVRETLSKARHEYIILLPSGQVTRLGITKHADWSQGNVLLFSVIHYSHSDDEVRELLKLRNVEQMHDEGTRTPPRRKALRLPEQTLVHAMLPQVSYGHDRFR